jgi:hypothetical protein
MALAGNDQRRKGDPEAQSIAGDPADREATRSCAQRDGTRTQRRWADFEVLQQRGALGFLGRPFPGAECGSGWW